MPKYKNLPESCENSDHELKKQEPSKYKTDNYFCVKCTVQFRKPWVDSDIYVQRVKNLKPL